MMPMDKLIKEYMTKINVTLDAKNDLFKVEKHNKEVSKRAVKAVNNTYKIKAKTQEKNKGKSKQ